MKTEVTPTITPDSQKINVKINSGEGKFWSFNVTVEESEALERQLQGARKFIKTSMEAISNMDLPIGKSEGVDSVTTLDA